MAAVRFQANGRIRWSTLATALANVSDGASTMAFGPFKRGVDDSNFHGLSYLLSSTGNGVTEFGLSLNGSDLLVLDADGFSASTLAITGTTENYFIVASKAAGAGAWIYSRYVKSTTTWTHETVGTRIDQVAATFLDIGCWENTSDLLNGWVGCVGYWEGAMTQANKEALVTNWRTSDLWTSAHGQPAFLTQLNTLTPTDLAGNASGINVGASLTLDAGETLASWNFDGVGGAAPTVKTGAGIVGP